MRCAVTFSLPITLTPRASPSICDNFALPSGRDVFPKRPTNFTDVRRCAPNSAIERGIVLAEDVDLRMANSNSTARPVWQKNPLFRFFASLKLAVVLLAVLIVAAITGTLYESSFDANVARAYVYGAPWFN